MDGARQALRWSIPGFIFVLELYVFHAVWLAILGQDPFASARTASSTSALATVFAGVPLGFLLYQLYYRNYRPLGRSVILAARYPWAIFRGRYGVAGRWTFLRRDRGAAMLRAYYRRGGTREFVERAWSGENHLADKIEDVTCYQRILGRFGPVSMHVLKLKVHLHDECDERQPMACGTCRKMYKQRFLFNWGVVMAMIDYASNTPQGASIRAEYAAGSDIYHALGAARTAVSSAALATLGHHLVLTDPGMPSLGQVLPAIAVTVLAYVQYQVLHSARESTAMNLAVRTSASLAWYSRQLCTATGSNA